MKNMETYVIIREYENGNSLLVCADTDHRYSHDIYNQEVERSKDSSFSVRMTKIMVMHKGQSIEVKS